MNTLRNWLLLLGIYLGVPTAMLILPVDLRVRLAIPVMLVIAAGCLISLSRNKRSRRTAETGVMAEKGHCSVMVFRFLIGGALLAVVARLCFPAWFLSLPTDHPRRWLAICMLYPLFSVCPQELIYRVYFFDLAGTMFPGLGHRGTVILNAVLFGYAHIVFGNVWAPLMAAAGGAMFASTYASRRSFWCVAVEHSLWGGLIFTLGFGAVFAGGTVARLLPL